MIISCPKCQVQYDIPESFFAQGQRRVRCSNCAFEWDHRAAASASSAGTDETPNTPPMEPMAKDGKTHDRDAFSFLSASADARPALKPGLASRQKAHGSPFFLLGLLGASVAALCLYLFAQPVVQAMPALAPAYRMLNVEPILELKDWSACIHRRSMVIAPNGQGWQYTAQVRVENRSSLGRVMPRVELVPQGPDAKTFSGVIVAGAPVGQGAYVDPSADRNLSLVVTGLSHPVPAPLRLTGLTSQQSIALSDC